jgi:hypothetical protein
MCLLRRDPQNPQSRRILAAGNMCLSSGLMLTIFGEGLRHRHPDIFDGLRFVLIGIAIGLLFWSARRVRANPRCC